jgi:Tol biopolymer transport system component
MSNARYGCLICCSLLFGVVPLRDASDQNFTGWSVPANPLMPLNSEVQDGCPSVSRDGLTIYLASRRYDDTNPNGTLDIWVSHRASLDAPWQTPRPLGSNVNSPTSNELCPSISRDGHALFFVSDGPILGANCGLRDLYVTRRRDAHDDSGWGTPELLPCGEGMINTAAHDWGEVYWESDDGTAYLYLTSTRAGGAGLDDIYVSTRLGEGEWSVVTPMAALNTSAVDKQPAISRDGLQFIFSSTRSGGQGAGDLWIATRATTDDDWGTPVNLDVFNAPGAIINSPDDETRPALSWDGTELYFGSSRTIVTAGGEDVWVATRRKITGRKN